MDITVPYFPSFLLIFSFCLNKNGFKQVLYGLFPSKKDHIICRGSYKGSVQDLSEYLHVMWFSSSRH